MKKEAVGPQKDVNGRRFSRGKVAQSNVVERVESDAVFAVRMSNIVSFAGMGMNADEIRLALNIATRENVPPSEINSVLTTAITKGSLPNFVTEEKERSTENSDSATREERVNKVLKLAIARETIIKAETVTKPQGKDEWEKVVESMGNIDKPLDVVKKLLRRGISLPDAMQIAKLEHTPTEDPIVRFAQELAAADGVIIKDKSEFNQLIAICNQNRIRLPHMAHYIVLEAFLNARKGIRIKPQDLTLLNRYQELRNMFFNEENIETSESMQLQELGDLEDRIGEIDDTLEYRVDNVGSYRHNKEGERLYTPLHVSDKGKIVLDNPGRSQEREESRNRIVAFRRRGKVTKATKSAALWDITHPLDAKR